MLTQIAARQLFQLNLNSNNFTTNNTISFLCDVPLVPLKTHHQNSQTKAGAPNFDFLEKEKSQFPLKNTELNDFMEFWRF